MRGSVDTVRSFCVDVGVLRRQGKCERARHELLGIWTNGRGLLGGRFPTTGRINGPDYASF